jgi:hypothetical protein
MSPSSEPSPKGNSNPFRFYGVVFELVIFNIVLIVGGYYLDLHLSSSPVFILVGTFLAVAGTIWLLIKRLQ